MIKVVSYQAEQAGPKLLVLGAVHGDEKCGTEAIYRVLKEFESGALGLACGSVTFVPICNPRAYEADVRFIERNLNRFLVPQEKPDCYEAQLGNILCPLLRECDVLLDLHSYDVGGPPFVFVGPAKAEDYAYAQCLGASAMLTGWAAAYAATGRASATDPQSEESTGTTEYSRRFGAMSVTLECGQHKDPASFEFAYQAIHRVLGYLGLVDRRGGEPVVEPARLVEVRRVFYRDGEGAFTKEWKHLESVVKGQIVARYENGETVCAPDDGYLVLPHAGTGLGAEWFYWGAEKEMKQV